MDNPAYTLVTWSQCQMSVTGAAVNHQYTVHSDWCDQTIVTMSPVSGTAHVCCVRVILSLITERLIQNNMELGIIIQ